MADQKRKEEAAHALGTGAPAATIDAAFGPNFQAWQDHVVRHVHLPDRDRDGTADLVEPVVPILTYGDGPNDYIATDVDAGQVMVRDGNDPTGKAWKWPLSTFLRFVAHAQGVELEGDDEEGPQGDNPYVAAAKQQERTNQLVQGERDAAAAAEQDGRTSTAASNRTAAAKTAPAGKK